MTISVLEDVQQVAQAAALRFVLVSNQTIRTSGRFSVALSGGQTPRLAYQQVTLNHRDQVDWSRTHIFFGDERCVPSNHPDSNYRSAYESLLSHVPIPAANVHAMKGDGDPVVNARTYESELRKFFQDGEWPRFDLILLGLGDDGHTASLFPGTSALDEQRAWVVANWVPKFQSWRLTLTLPAINHGRHIVFLVTGSAKSSALAQVMTSADLVRLPAGLVQPIDGSLEWLVDKAAAVNLPKDS